MTTPAIEVVDVSKSFRVYNQRPDSLKERITSLHRIQHEDFWALKHVNVTVPKGSVYGLVGHNGSGKSSLLRIMAGIHRPTSGVVHTDGRISALLELGAGFHPDLSGRENIFLNAAILGLTKKETERLFDQIVEFSGLRDFIDTPVKHYSSGMYVRLGFSVAVHVDPQILIVDEVIAVGDEEFQRRCFDFLNRLRRRGVTIVMVTHGLPFVQTMCDEATWLDHGEVQAQGDAVKVVNEYLTQVNQDEAERIEHETAEALAEGRPVDEHPVTIEDIEFLGLDGHPLAVALTGQPLTVRVHFHTHEPIPGPLFSFAMQNETGAHVANPGMQPFAEPRPIVPAGRGHVDYTIGRLPLAPGLYTFFVAAHDPNGMTVLHRRDEIATLRVQPHGEFIAGMVDLLGDWTLPQSDGSGPASPSNAPVVDDLGAPASAARALEG